MATTQQQQKEWQLYLAKAAARRRITRNVRTPFEAANVQPWVTCADSARSVGAVGRIVADFERADTEAQ